MFNDILNYILGLGAAIFLPIIMIILGLCVKMKLKKAIMAGLTLGIAFTGMNVVLGFMFSSIINYVDTSRRICITQCFIKVHNTVYFNAVDRVYNITV